jgi:translation initiation factor 5B
MCIHESSIDLLFPVLRIRPFIVHGTLSKISVQVSARWILLEEFGNCLMLLPLHSKTHPRSRRSVFFLGLLAGGPLAMWSNFLITLVGMWITAAVLAEICSALPLSGSIYIWAAESAGPKYARFFGFVVAWWSCTAWMTFVAGNCQVCPFSIICHD